MMKKNQALKITLIVMVVAIVVIAGYYAIKQNTQTASSRLIDDGPDVTYDGSRYRYFESEELGVAFSYPAAWGELTQWVDAPPERMAEYRTEATISTNDTPFLALLTQGSIPPRDGWWGDIAVEATDEATVETFCDTYQDLDRYYVQPNEACEILINGNGTTFARLGGSTTWYGWEVEDTYVYITAHQGHPYFGIALSAQSLARTDLEGTLGNVEKAIQEIANSLVFIDAE